jgi:nicotinamidase/pyrazinamidase
MKSALIMVDLQNDFIPGGALAVPAGDQVVSIANQVQSHFKHIIATQDWHPANHASFAVNQPGHAVGDGVLWPVHCVQHTSGAALVNTLDIHRIERIFHKGTDPQIDSYSAFFDNEHRKETGLADYLHELKTTQLYILGLATDYCVKFTVLDARQLGFDVCVIENGCRGIDLAEGDSKRAIAEMHAAGARVIQSTDL